MVSTSGHQRKALQSWLVFFYYLNLCQIEKFWGVLTRIWLEFSLSLSNLNSTSYYFRKRFQTSRVQIGQGERIPARFWSGLPKTFQFDINLNLKK